MRGCGGRGVNNLNLMSLIQVVLYRECMMLD
jgi:hypothetical protein